VSISFDSVDAALGWQLLDGKPKKPSATSMRIAGVAVPRFGIAAVSLNQAAWLSRDVMK
jgi:hypothetical protein